MVTTPCQTINDSFVKNEFFQKGGIFKAFISSSMLVTVVISETTFCL